MLSELRSPFTGKTSLFFALCLLLSTGVVAQNIGGPPSMGEAVSMLDKAEKPEDYLFLVGAFKALSQHEPGQWLAYYYTAYCNVRLGMLAKEDEEKNKGYSDAALESIKQAEAECSASCSPFKAEVYNVYSLAYRVLIAAKPMVNGRKFGSVANDYLAKALKLAPRNPRSLYISGQVKYLTPALFGGDKKKAKELLTAALKSFNEQQSSPVLPHWGKKDCELLLSKID